MLLSLFAVWPVEASSRDDLLLVDYVALQAMRPWGAQRYCSAPGHQRLLQRIDIRIGRIRSALLERHGEEAVAEAESVGLTTFYEEVETIGVGLACRRDLSSNRRYNADLERSYEAALRPLEATLGLKRR